MNDADTIRADLVAPIFEVRIEVTPAIPLHALRVNMPELALIRMHPPASGPEIELVIGTFDDAEPLTEDQVREDVERWTNRPVLAIRTRDEVPQ